MTTTIAEFYRIFHITNNGICPTCHLKNNVIKYGKKRNKQTFKCNFCGLRFNEHSNTVFAHSKLTISVINKLLLGFLEGFTAKQSRVLLSLDDSNVLTYVFNNKYMISAKSIKKWYKLFLNINHSFMDIYLENLVFNEPVEKMQGHPRFLSYWVFGIKGLITKRCLIVPVISRTRELLFTIIQRKDYM